MSRAGGREVGRYWTPIVKGWWLSNPQVILEFPSAGVDFCGHPEMGFSLVDAWGLIGM